MIGQVFQTLPPKSSLAMFHRPSRDMAGTGRAFRRAANAFGRHCLARAEGCSTPFRLSLHVGDVGHTLVVGPTGAGKSVLLALMVAVRRYAARTKQAGKV
ncbi:hypothetical protein DPM13_16245 [Paracoccus mutanolyticus]|uniref:ABC transporter domain-containing protein n=1 Tax=Paracoccus mutanolyticus TaxID=1499308 RepID=A0ABN5M7J4_9RHOB|nr:hypothetical protein DPM13_16245 [Paracoccus mutanolyticus]